MDEKLKKLRELIDILLDPTEDKMLELLNEEIKKASKENTKISIVKKADGKSCTNLEGSTTAILVTLAGLEKSVLQKLDVPYCVWEYIKEHVKSEEVKDNE